MFDEHLPLYINNMYSIFFICLLCLKGFLQLIILALVDLIVYLFNAPAGGLIESLPHSTRKEKSIVFILF
jgi:hypothetical protein